jgi:hypothetical protein
MLASPEELRGAARALQAARVSVESDQAALRRAESVFTRWRSPAADDVHQVLFPLCVNSLGFVVRDLDDLAGLLHRAADQLEERLARIASIESRVRWWFAHQPPPEDGSLPRWEREWWRYRPGRLPARGDSTWLDAATYLRARGVSV